MKMDNHNRTSLYLTFGGIDWEIRFEEGLEPLASFFTPLFKGFLTDKHAADVVLHVACDFKTRVRRPPAEPILETGEEGRFAEVRSTLNRLFAVDPYTPLVAFKNGCIACREDSSEAHVLIYGTRNFNNPAGTFYKLFNMFSSLFFVEKDGLLLHGSALDCRGEGLLFLGRSGAGKTTVASQAPLEQVLSDDAPVIRKGGGEGFLIYATPFRQLHAFIPYHSDDTNRKIPLKSIYFLRRSDKLHIESLGRAKALAETVGHHIHAFWLMSASLRKKAFLTCHELFGAVEARELYFAKDDRILEAITETGER